MTLRPPFHGISLSDATRLIEALAHPDIVGLALVHARSPNRDNEPMPGSAPRELGAQIGQTANQSDAVKKANDQRSLELDKLASSLAERAAQMGQSGQDFYNNVKAERYELDTLRDKLNSREAALSQREDAILKREMELAKKADQSEIADPNL